MTMRISALVSLAVVCLVASSCGGVPGDAVVQVNGNSITKTTFKHWLGVAAASSSASAQTPTKTVVPEPPAYTACIAHLKETEGKLAKGKKPKTEAALKTECETQYTSFKQAVLSYLISSEWVLGEASHLGVKVSDNQVKKEFAKIRTQEFPKEADFKKFLTSSGQTISDLLLRVKVNLLSAKVKTKTETVKPPTQAQIAKYYNENKSQYGKPESRDLLIVLTKDEAEANKAKREIQSGKSFQSVAKRVSIDPTSKTKGGSLPGVTRGEEEQALSEAVFAAKQGVLSGPVKTPFGFYIFQVKTIHAGSEQTLAQAQSAIRQTLSSTGKQTALNTFIKQYTKKWKGKTNCGAQYMVKECKDYKAPKASSTPAPVTTTATTTPQTTSTQSKTTKAPSKTSSSSSSAKKK
jgi:foldase protein PrsA